MSAVALKEFHISRSAREKYEFDESIFSSRGNVVFANFHGARVFAQKMNRKRDLLRHPEQVVRAGHIAAMGLLDEILHYVVHAYQEQANPQAAKGALEWLDGKLGPRAVDVALRSFVERFPSLPVYRGEVSVSDYLSATTDGVANREIALEELLMLWLTNENPACLPFAELFDDASLRESTPYLRVVRGLRDFFDTQPRFGPDDENLVDMLRRPALESPHSLSGQLEFCLRRWGYLLGPLALRLLSVVDLIKEEERLTFLGPGPALVPVYDRARLRAEPERFSPDRDWMPNLVLIAKNAHVWLDQLSRKHRRELRRLDDIPDEELDNLRNWGFTGLWLIGLWQRSQASRRIKHLMGNVDAVASAYSLFDYRIADDLGGDAALQRLKERAWQRGIRLASDMVPNHMAIDSRWVIEHPDWFISLDYSPFPSYSFGGPDLSWDERVGIFLEDHYYNHTDAAVVFKRVDRWTGSEKYVYHGNDGTSMPWNDTAQLNYLLPEVREGVIQTILHVARQFPVIRFDAAMTLAKQHYQRLWFPEPGTGGAIPSRAEFGLTQEQFDAAMPEEFWREVVDRVAVEAPDTLLLAEAFWLMEGYFVRTLGMHRVYNSAFMNMLRDEDNAKYRSVMKNTMEFDPEIMKRYVNFMNNPDERTAIDQFGKDDKYFGICTMLATLPGLPMFGHGQIEGFTEKYGMEYQRAYYDEQPDAHLIWRHEREIFPLLHRRYLFAGVENFLLYDLFTPEGHVNEDVFAYSNRVDDERALVVYHNKFATARGWIRTSAAYAVKSGGGENRTLVQRTLGEGLGLSPTDGRFAVFRDGVSGLEYIRSSRDLCERGLFVELSAYQRNVFLDFREVHDTHDGLYSRLAWELEGRGVPSVDEAARELALRPIRQPFRDLVSAERLRRLVEVVEAGEHLADARARSEAISDLEPEMARAVEATAAFAGVPADASATAARTRRRLEVLLTMPRLAEDVAPSGAPGYGPAISYLGPGLADRRRWATLFGWVLTESFSDLPGPGEAGQEARSRIDEWLLGKPIEEALRGAGLDEAAARDGLSVVKLLVGDVVRSARHRADRPDQILDAWLEDEEAQRFLKLNRYGDAVWYNKEAFEDLLWYMLATSLVRAVADVGAETTQARRSVATRHEAVVMLERAMDESGYRVDALKAAARRLGGLSRPSGARHRSS